MARDTGGEYTSLAGMKGKYGLETRGGSAWAVGSSVLVVMPDNPRRMCASIVNSGTDNVYIYPAASGNEGSVYLRPGGSFQIDKDFPWTGAVNVVRVTNDTTIDWWETSVL